MNLMSLSKLSQFILNRKPSYVQEALYQELRDLSRFYQNLTEDIVCSKNRLHKVLQVTFPELENILSSPTGKQYWNLVMAFPCNSFVLELDDAALRAIIRQSTSKRISEKRVTYLVDKLTKLANHSYCAVKKTSPMMEEVKDSLVAKYPILCLSRSILASLPLTHECRNLFHL